MGLATVDPISDATPWSAKGAAGDALQRAPHNRPFIAMWFGEDGALRYSKANTDFASLSMFAITAQEFAQACVRDTLLKKDK